MVNKHFNKAYPTKPVIRKLGTIKCDVVETTPIVFNGRLYRMEYFRAARHNEANDVERTHMHFVDVYTNRLTTPFAFDHHFGNAYTEDGVMYVAATRGKELDSSNGFIDFYRSTDLENWEQYSSLEFPDVSTYNTGICKMNGKYILLTEVNKPYPFTFVFAESDDLTHWTHLPPEKMFQKGRYAGGPAIYTLPNDPYYYVFYLESYPGARTYTNCAARSLDLEHWEYSLMNPVLIYDEDDKKIGSPFLTLHEQERIRRAININNSDLEMCDFNGRTIMYYSWGGQNGNEYLAEAAYEGTMEEFIHALFAEPTEM